MKVDEILRPSLARDHLIERVIHLVHLGIAHLVKRNCLLTATIKTLNLVVVVVYLVKEKHVEK